MKTILAVTVCLVLFTLSVGRAQEAPVPLMPATPPATPPPPAQPQVQQPAAAPQEEASPPLRGSLPSLAREFPMPEEVKQEVDRLFSISPSDRARACWNLGKLGTRAVHAVPFLLALTADTNVAWFCTDGQGRWTTPGREAAYALGRIGPVALDSVLLLVPASRPSMRMNAAIALGEIGSPAAVPALLTLLKDSDWAVREQAAVALGKIKDSSAMEPLSAALKDPEWKVRMAAISAIAGIGGKAAVEPLLSVLDDRFPHIRAAATACLRDITGQDFGDTRDTWMKWWQEQKHTMQ